MVKLTKIYTKTGDDGTTGLASGARVRKDDLRVECYGTVDEANAAIGVAVAHCSPGEAVASKLAELLSMIQQDLFDVGADLSTPIAKDEKPGKKLRVVESQTVRLEKTIDLYNEQLSPLNSFVLPGGTALAASLHVARTVVRRGERLAVALAAKEEVNQEAIKYLNRLSDLLFVLCRVANDFGKGDVLWVPGVNRGKK
jgi:cob(I)alamin adenosyltransferase